MREKIAIVIVNYNGSEDTIECLDSIYMSDNREFEVIIIDNASTDNSIMLLEEYFLQMNMGKKVKNFHGLVQNNYEGDNFSVSLISNIGNLGFASANNIGIRFAKECNFKYLFFLNNDTTIESSLLESLVNKSISNIDSNPICIVPKVISYYDESYVDSDGYANINLLTSQSSHHKSYFYNHQYVVASALFVSDVEILPEMDDNFFLYYEDADYFKRLSCKGYQTVFLSDSIVRHKVSKSTSMNPMIEEIKLQSMIFFYKKNYKKFLPILIILRVIYYTIRLDLKYLVVFVRSLKLAK